MNPKTEEEVFQLYERIKPLINPDKASLPKHGFFQKMLKAVGFPLGLDEKEERFNLAMAEIVKFIHPELEYKPDASLPAPSVVVSQLFLDGTVLGSSTNIIDGYVNGVHLKQAYIRASQQDNHYGTIGDPVEGYFYFMPFYKDVFGYVMVQKKQAGEILDNILESIKGKAKPLFNDNGFNEVFEIEFDNASTALSVLDEEVRSAVMAFHSLYPESMYSFTHDYLWIFIPERSINPSLYDNRPIDLRQLEKIIKLFEAGAVAVDIFKLDR